MFYCTHDSPVGPLFLAGDEDHVTAVSFPTSRPKRGPDPGWTKNDKPLVKLRTQLDEYFAGTRRTFSLTLKPQGTPFQLKVWWALYDIPFGETVSYGEIARTIGQPTASRAVGAANGLNPIPIIIPCHRVIGSSGKLTGFGGGLECKATLLDHERRVMGPDLEQAAFNF